MRKLTIIVGRPRSGKSYLVEKICTAFRGRKMVYNYGLASDFSLAHNAAMINTSGNIFFRFRFSEKDFVVDSAKFFSVCRYVRMQKTTAAENKFWERVCMFFSGLLVVDDAGGITRHGLSTQLTDLSQRLNHTGYMSEKAERGTDMIFMYHNLQQVPSGFWRYATNVILFQSSGFDGLKTGNLYLEKTGKAAVEKLAKYPIEKRVRVEIDLLEQKEVWFNL